VQVPCYGHSNVASGRLGCRGRLLLARVTGESLFGSGRRREGMGGSAGVSGLGPKGPWPLYVYSVWCPLYVYSVRCPLYVYSVWWPLVVYSVWLHTCPWPLYVYSVPTSCVSLMGTAPAAVPPVSTHCLSPCMCCSQYPSNSESVATHTPMPTHTPITRLTAMPRLWI